MSEDRIKVRTKHRMTMGLAGPGIPAAHGYTAEVRAKISAAQLGKPHPQRKEECSCGRITTPGPLVRHMAATGHHRVRRLPRG